MTNHQGRYEPDAPPSDRAWAVIGYLAAALLAFALPLAVYLCAPPRSRFLRAHAAQAVNAALTLLMYTLCAAILGGIFWLDSARVAIGIGASVGLAIWAVTLGYLTSAAIAARAGAFRRIPSSLCAALLRPRQRTSTASRS